MGGSRSEELNRNGTILPITQWCPQEARGINRPAKERIKNVDVGSSLCQLDVVRVRVRVALFPIYVKHLRHHRVTLLPPLEGGTRAQVEEDIQE
jgi:hypothetical protein